MFLMILFYMFLVNVMLHVKIERLLMFIMCQTLTLLYSLFLN
jgi:hypothetical protein